MMMTSQWLRLSLTASNKKGYQIKLCPSLFRIRAVPASENILSMPIYTKKGDLGKTSTLQKRAKERESISKGSQLIETIGVLDEASSVIGICVSKMRNNKKENKNHISNLVRVQNNLMSISSIVAGSNVLILKKEVTFLERQIDRLENENTKLRNFIIVGGSELASMLHLSRAVVRRAERQVVRLGTKVDINKKVYAYLNRLSDYLFVLARFINKKEGFKEKLWTR